MPKLRHSSAILPSCFSHSTTNPRRCCMGEVSFQGTHPPQVRTVGVNHVLGPVCHPCPRSVPVQGAEPWGERPQSFDLKRKLVRGSAQSFDLKKKLSQALASGLST